MRSLRMFFVAVPLISAVVLTTSPSANSGEKRCRTILNCNQPVPATCTGSASQSVTPIETCCQPIAASVQPQIELVAYTRPASPRRLTPQPDALDIRRTTTDLYCAQFMAWDYGSYQVYYGLRCSDNYPAPIYGYGLGPLPGDCGSPNGACLTGSGSSIVPTAINKSSSGVFQKSVQLGRKRKTGEEPRNQVNGQATGAHQLIERTIVGQPIYIQFDSANGTSGPIVVELQRVFVKGTGKSAQALSGTFALGTEINAPPAGEVAKEFGRQQVQVIDDHIARVEIGNVIYDIVTATKLTP